ncbi:hypothetical protein MMC26_002352 [Xylographa opegraphella]|nr:hypothetical protein [Xylographa opegraphella]
MLLPSAIPCEARARPLLQRALPFSPPLSPPQSSQFSSGIFSTCRALQSLIGVQAPPSRYTQQSRLRPIPTKIEKRKPPRGVNKRRREANDNGTHDAVEDQENTYTGSRDGYSTPKRQRLAPPSIPLGLERRDFFALQPTPLPNFSKPQYSHHQSSEDLSPPLQDNEQVCETKSDASMGDWDSEDDSVLVNLVLEKLRLSKRDWEECARVLGTDRGSLGRRWKELVGDGEVGLKFRRGRKGVGRRDVRGVWEGL